MNGRKPNNWLSLSILLVLIIGMGLFFRSNPNLFEPVRQISWRLFLLLILLRFLFLMLNGLTLKLFVARFSVQLRWQEWAGLALVTTLGNYITPFSGGMVARATYLKVKHQLTYAKFTALLAASYLVTFGVAALLGIFSLLWLQQWQSRTLFLLLFFVFILLGVLVAMGLPMKWLPKGNNRLLRTITAVIEGWQQLRSDRDLLLQLTAVTILSMLLNGVAFWVAYQALGFDEVPFEAAILVSLSAVYSVILTVTPGNVGIREALVSLTSELIAIGVGEGLLVALLIRLGTLATVFTLGPLSSVWLARQIE